MLLCPILFVSSANIPIRNPEARHLLCKGLVIRKCKLQDKIHTARVMDISAPFNVLMEKGNSIDINKDDLTPIENDGRDGVLLLELYFDSETVGSSKF